MAIPLYIFLYLYFAFLFVWAIFCMIAIFHMFKFGFANFSTFISTILFIFISVILLLISFNFINQIDWGVNIPILGSLGSVKIY